MSAREPRTAPILIVGGGPVGLMLALFLDRHGVKSTVFNDAHTTRWHPKGSTHNARTMEHYRRLGLSAAVRSLGLPLEHPGDVAYLTRYSGWELARIRLPSEQEKQQAVCRAAKLDQVPEPIHRANQMYVERMLLEHAATRSNITLRFGWKAARLRNDEHEVSLDVESVAAESAETWRGDYLVGCDGGQSFVRRSLGIGYEGLSSFEADNLFYSGRMIAIYFRAPRFYDVITNARRAWMYWAVNPQMRTVAVSLNGRDEFLMFTKAPGASAPDVSELAHRIQGQVGAPIPLEILGAIPWTGGIALTAERFGLGRVLLAGDAVHLFTPSGGFGMNTGIDDAANLAWKLAAMVQGWGGARLLASYELERRPVAKRNTTAAREFALNIGGIVVPDDLEASTSDGEAARAKLEALIRTRSGEEFASIGVQLGARYDASPIVVSDAPPPSSHHAQYVPTSIPGGRAPHLWLDAGRAFGSSLFDRFGIGFSLLCLNADRSQAERLARRAGRKGIPMQVIEISDSDARDLYERDYALVRPDQHVAWRGNTLPSEPDAMLETVTGARDRT